MRGQRALPAPSSTLQEHFESGIRVHIACCAWQGRFTPHPLPLVSGDMDLFGSAGRQRWYVYLMPVCSRN